MATSSILGADDDMNPPSPGKDIDALGPSDSSDSGSDVQGERPMATGADDPDQWGAVMVDPDSDTDALGTGERASAGGDDPIDAADIRPDHIENFTENPERDLNEAAAQDQLNPDSGSAARRTP